MLSPDVANVIIPLHIITGSDHSSGGFGHGLKRVLKNVINDPEARQLLMAVGDNITLEDPRSIGTVHLLHVDKQSHKDDID